MTVNSNAARADAANTLAPAAPLDTDAVKNAYRRWANFYDVGFGLVSSLARRRAIEEVNRLPGNRVLEVGVGTGLALPHYASSKSVTGIDLSGEMLEKARKRTSKLGLSNVESLLEMDAESMDFEADRFDLAVAMFVASVVPHPRRLIAEMRRVVRPGGHILFINHFSRDKGIIANIEAGLARSSKTLGWHPDFRIGALLNAEDRIVATSESQWPLGLFTLLRMPN